MIFVFQDLTSDKSFEIREINYALAAEQAERYFGHGRFASDIHGKSIGQMFDELDMSWLYASSTSKVTLLNDSITNVWGKWRNQVDEIFRELDLLSFAEADDLWRFNMSKYEEMQDMYKNHRESF